MGIGHTHAHRSSAAGEMAASVSGTSAQQPRRPGPSSRTCSTSRRSPAWCTTSSPNPACERRSSSRRRQRMTRAAGTAAAGMAACVCLTRHLLSARQWRPYLRMRGPFMRLPSAAATTARSSGKALSALLLCCPHCDAAAWVATACCASGTPGPNSALPKCWHIPARSSLQLCRWTCSRNVFQNCAGSVLRLE